MKMNNAIQQHYQEVQTEILKTCQETGRDAQTVKLVVVSKSQDAEKIRCLLKAGQRDFGENRIEEIEKKWSALLIDYPDVKLHFIGVIQSRKVRNIVKYCQYIHSIDRLEIAEKIARECRLQNKITNCLIQVNIGAEPQKAGIPIEQLPTFLTECNQHIQLPIAGIMCIPPINQDPAAYFRLMQKLRLEYRLKELSMGMSDDYVEAISNGATMIRVGSKILVS